MDETLNVLLPNSPFSKSTVFITAIFPAVITGQEKIIQRAVQKEGPHPRPLSKVEMGDSVIKYSVIRNSIRIGII
jgi:hypothetical protein